MKPQSRLQMALFWRAAICLARLGVSGKRQTRGEDGAALGCAAHAQLSAERCHPIAEAHESVAARVGATNTVVAHLEVESTVQHRCSNSRPLRIRVLHD